MPRRSVGLTPSVSRLMARPTMHETPFLTSPPFKTLIEIKVNLSYEEIPIQIVDHQVCKCRTKEVASIKVLWRNQLLRKLLEKLRKI